MRNAYAVGVLKALYDHAGGADGWDALYAVSAGVYAATFFLAGQVREMVHTWESYVHGSQVIRYTNVLRRRPVADLDHLIQLFQGPKSFLDLRRVFGASAALTYVLTDARTGRPVYVDAKCPEIFDLMRAASALPPLYPPVRIRGNLYLDGGACDSLPVERALLDGHREITVIMTQPRRQRPPVRLPWLASLGAWRIPGARRALARSDRSYTRALRLIRRPPPGVEIRVFRPDTLDLHLLRRSQSAIAQAIQHGIRDGEKGLAASVGSSALSR